MRKLLLTLLLPLSIDAIAQSNSSNYDDPSDVKAGDVVILNEPSDPNYYRSIYFTFKAAKIVYPDVNADKYEKVYLSYKFAKTPFTVHKVKGKKTAILSYGVVKNFAVMDLDLAFKSGEIGKAENIAKTWLADELQPGDSILFKQPTGSTYQHATLSANKAPLGADHNGKTYIVNEVKRGVASLALGDNNDFISVNLVRAIETDEIEIREDVTLYQESTSHLDRISYSKPDNTIFGKIGLEPFGFAGLNFTGIEGNGNTNYDVGFGFIVRDNLQIGGFHTFRNSNYTKILFVDRVNAGYHFEHEYSGVFMGYQFFQKGATTLVFQSKFGSGDVAWELETNRDRVIDSDRFLIINPSIGLDFQFTKVSMLHIALGFRSISGLEMRDIDAGAMNSVTLSMALKIGRFR
ncbi:MAG: hypothetical protein RJQ09_13400 [Cyclobacteriaceae bacterium]